MIEIYLLGTVMYCTYRHPQQILTGIGNGIGNGNSEQMEKNSWIQYSTVKPILALRRQHCDSVKIKLVKINTEPTEPT